MIIFHFCFVCILKYYVNVVLLESYTAFMVKQKHNNHQVLSLFIYINFIFMESGALKI